MHAGTKFPLPCLPVRWYFIFASSPTVTTMVTVADHICSAITSLCVVLKISRTAIDVIWTGRWTVP